GLSLARTDAPAERRLALAALVALQQERRERSAGEVKAQDDVRLREDLLAIERVLDRGRGDEIGERPRLSDFVETLDDLPIRRTHLRDDPRRERAHGGKRRFEIALVRGDHVIEDQRTRSSVRKVRIELVGDVRPRETLEDDVVSPIRKPC